MKMETNANGVIHGLGKHPAAAAGAGDLAATLWDTGDRCRIILFRTDQTTGKVDQILSPKDVIDLTKLSCVLADVLSTFTDLDTELRDTLGCLSSAVGDALGVGVTSGCVPEAVRDAMVRVLEYSLEDEGKHFRIEPSEDHIYRSLLLLALWIEDGIFSNACVLDPLEPDGHGVCPICGNDDEFVNIHRAHWHLCHRHGVRWMCGENLHSGWRSESQEDWQANWERIGHYREVVPYVTAVSCRPRN